MSTVGESGKYAEGFLGGRRDLVTLCRQGSSAMWVPGETVPFPAQMTERKQWDPEAAEYEGPGAGALSLGGCPGRCCSGHGYLQEGFRRQKDTFEREGQTSVCDPHSGLVWKQ